MGAATYHQIAVERLDRLSTALGLEVHHGRFRALVSWLFRGWGDLPVPEQAPYESSLTADHSPFEYALSFAGVGAELSLRVEAQAASPSLAANREAALAFNERLLPFGVDFDRFERVRDLFLPTTVEPPFSLWHELTLRPGAGAGFKLHLNPRAAGAARALPLVKEALARLDVKKAEPVLDMLLRRGDGLDELACLSLDLSPASGAEVRVYVRHLAVSVADLERTLAYFPAHHVGDAVGLCRALARGDSSFKANPPLTSVAFGHGSSGPSAAAVDLPLERRGGADDGEFSRQITLYLASLGLDSNAYARALASFAHRALTGKAGIQSRLSFTREAHGPRVTVYLSPEVFSSSAASSSRTRVKGGASDAKLETGRAGKKVG